MGLADLPGSGPGWSSLRADDGGPASALAAVAAPPCDPGLAGLALRLLRLDIAARPSASEVRAEIDARALHV